MKTLFLAFIFVLLSANIKGREMEFGQITITPFIADNIELDETGEKLLYTKLSQIITKGEASGGFDRRFVITPVFNILSENTTATIPQKVSIKISFTFFIGDGVSGSLFGASEIETTGVGDNRKNAVYSAIRKIDTNDEELQLLISDSKKRIVKYYNTVSPNLINEAKSCMAAADYETAISKLSTIPSMCDEYDTAQKMIVECGGKLLDRDNNNLLTKAQAAWSSNPNVNGAREANEYISQICVTSSSLKREIDKFTNEIRARLVQIENKEIELERARIASQENIEKEQIAASARIATSVFNALPKIAYHIFNWF